MEPKVAWLLFLLATLRPLAADSDDCKGKMDDVEDGQTEEDRRRVWEARQEMEARAQRQLNISHEGSPAPACYFFQGDIALRPEEALTLLDSINSRRKRKVTSEMAELWTLPIPYRFSQDARYKMDAGEQQLLRDALDHWTSLTCLTFQEVGPEVTNQTVLVFKKDSGCWSYVGRKSVFTEQEISIGPHCFSVGTIAHEVGHAVGFWHEHSRPDRDHYIRVHYENVRYGEDFNFFRESWQYVNERNIPYDVGSIMHYGATDFAQNSGALTIETRDPLVQRVPGQRQGLSFYDAKTANIAYCQHVCAGSTVQGRCQHDGYPDPKNCLRCRCPEGLHGTLCTQPSPPVVPCGGLLYIAATETYTIQSPGFPLGYQPGQTCAWLIKAPAGKSVFLRVSSRSFLHSSACTGFNTSVCRDFLEVKYNVSFSHTGARFCCSTPPDRTIVSNGPAMLVIFKAIGQGQGGFIANISAESCGGCAMADPPDQPACSELYTESCARTWTVRRFVSCPVLFAFDRNCGRTVEENMTRNGTCTQERQFCCQGFTLSNGRCLRQATTAQAATPTSQTLARTPAGDVTESDAGRGWGAWTPCSSSCGGCGSRNRTRICDDPSLCGGRAEDAQSEVCNTQPCPFSFYTFCSQTRRVVYLCKLLPVTYCTRYESVPVPCRSPCCTGFSLVNETCVASTR